MPPAAPEAPRPGGGSIAAVFDDPHAFLAILPVRGSLLALDASKRRIGVAGCDPSRRLVTPLVTIHRKHRAADLGAIARMLETRKPVAGLIIGWPLNMDGSAGPMAARARGFAVDLAGTFALPVLLQDERLTSFAVEDAIAEGRLARPAKPDVPLDHYAAAVILEDALRAFERRVSPLRS